MGGRRRQRANPDDRHRRIVGSHGYGTGRIQLHARRGRARRSRAAGFALCRPLRRRSRPLLRRGRRARGSVGRGASPARDRAGRPHARAARQDTRLARGDARRAEGRSRLDSLLRDAPRQGSRVSRTAFRSDAARRRPGRPGRGRGDGRAARRGLRRRGRARRARPGDGRDRCRGSRADHLHLRHDEGSEGRRAGPPLHLGKAPPGCSVGRLPPGRPRLVHGGHGVGEVALERPLRPVELRLGGRPPRGRIRRRRAVPDDRGAAHRRHLPGPDRVPAHGQARWTRDLRPLQRAAHGLRGRAPEPGGDPRSRARSGGRSTTATGRPRTPSLSATSPAPRSGRARWGSRLPATTCA